MNRSSPQENEYLSLQEKIFQLVKAGRTEAAVKVNHILIETYWNIGRYIFEFEQQGSSRAVYGDKLIKSLSKDLTHEFGKGFSSTNLKNFRSFYQVFSIGQTASDQFNIPTHSNNLSWSHYVELLKIENSLERNFYLKQCDQENWSVRELKRQMKSMLFNRLALSSDKKQVHMLAAKGAVSQSPKDLIKDPYVFEFLGIPQKEIFRESDLEEALIKNLEEFLLELGKGFAFIGRQYKITIGSRHFFIDLVFYHRILKCFVLIDLKRGEVEHGDVGQMNLYLNYFQKDENQEDDNPPIGLVLGAHKDHILMEYATANLDNQLFVSKYQLYLPDERELQEELEKLLN